MRQVKYTAELATDSLTVRNEIIDRAARLVPSFNLELSPPENAVSLYRMIAEISNTEDIYADLKIQSNRAAMAILADLEDVIRYAKDPLDTAIRLVIAGNIIDYGSHQEFDLKQTIDNILNSSLTISDLDDFRKDLQKAQSILYLADNCGELVFDRLLIELIGKPVTIAVKEKPIINDALRSDAEICGLSLTCRIISNGTDCPGTPLRSCSKEFIKEFEEADLIISKGQGNFETLSDINAPIYFMLMIKCPVVAKHLDEITGNGNSSISTGSTVLLKHSPPRSS
jgi:uncharacterized protein with ATP-grasp and redox domains